MGAEKALWISVIALSGEIKSAIIWSYLNMMTRVLIFGSLPSGFGGMEKVFIEFSKVFNQVEGYVVDFYMYELNKGNDYEWLNSISYQLYRPNIKLRLFQKIKIENNFMLYIQKQRPALIIAFDPLSVFLARKALTKAKLNVPLLSWLHFSFTKFKLKYQHYVLLADYHLSLCDTIKKQLIKKTVKDDNIFVIYNPIASKNYCISKPQEGSVKYLYVGRIQYANQKNLQEFFHALSNLNKPFTLDIVGDGTREEIKKLKMLAMKISITDKLIWHGWQKNPWEYVKKNIKTVSALVLTSTFEGCPMTLCEALSHGILCISSDCDTGPRDIINDNNGMLYNPGNINELIQCLDKVYLNSQLPEPITIQKSINHLYDVQYVNNLKKIFSFILEKRS